MFLRHASIGLEGVTALAAGLLHSGSVHGVVLGTGKPHSREEMMSFDRTGWSGGRTRDLIPAQGMSPSTCGVCCSPSLRDVFSTPDAVIAAAARTDGFL